MASSSTTSEASCAPAGASSRSRESEGLARERRQDPIAVTAAREAVSVLRETDDVWTLALATFYAGTFALVLAVDDPVPELEESRKLFAEIGDEWGVGGASFYLGVVATSQGQLTRARELIEDSVGAFRREGDRWREAAALDGLASVLDAIGEDATTHRAAAAALRRELGVP